jgi:putative membrane protein insertion efficiency factor
MLTKALCAPIRLYRAVTAGARPHCRYLPSCSQYSLEAIEAHGPRRGLWLAAKRVGRCHPWGGFGVDPVPEADVGGTLRQVTAGRLRDGRVRGEPCT